jgi:hypothetical protein
VSAARSIKSPLSPARCGDSDLFAFCCRVALILGLLLFSLSSPLQAQPATADLFGVVHDAGLAPLADVTVELTTGKLRLTQTTGPDGRFHFCCLPAGEFKVAFGHKRASRWGELELTLSPPGRYWVIAELPLASSGPWTLREVPLHEVCPETSTRTYTRHDVDWLPSTLNLWSLLGHTEISATAERFDVSGMHSDETMLFGSRGGSWSQNRVIWNGFNFTSADGARTLLLPDLSTAENVVYEALPTGFSLPGAELVLQPRSGGPTQHGEAHFFFQSGALQNVNVTPRLRSFGITESDERFHHFAQGNAQVGGPLSSGWTYYVAASRQQAEKWIRNDPLTVANSLTTGTANLMGDVSPRDRLSLAWVGQDSRQPQGGASPQVAREATRNTTRTFQGIQGSWTHIFSSRSLLDARAAFSSGKIDAALQPGTNQPSRVELFPSSVDIPFVPSAEAGRPIVALLNNVFTGAAPLAVASGDRRFEALLDFQTFRNGPMRSTHGISLGAEAVWLITQEQAHAFENINLRFFRGLPDSVQAFTGSDTQNSGTHFRGFAADNIRMGAFTFNLSTQGSWDRGSNARIGGLQKNRLGWASAGGFAGVGYRIGHRYPTVLRAAGAQRYHESLIHALEAVDPSGLGTSTYLWNDANHDGSFQAGELGPLVKVEGAPFSRLDPQLKQPYTREVHLEAEQELPWGFAVSLHAYRRVEHRLLGFMNTGVPSSDYAAVTVFDPGDDGASQTGDEAQRVAYNQDSATLGKDSYLLTNPSEASGFAEGYETRLSQKGTRLEWEFAFTRYRAVALTAPGNGPLQNDWSAFAVFNDPNQSINAYGSTYFDRGLGARFWGACQLPWSTQLSWITSFLDGAPYGRILPVTGLNQGLFGILATRRGPGDGSPNEGKRTAHNLTTDLRLSRGFRLCRGRLAASLDAFNLLNSAYALQEADVTSPTHLWRIPLRFQTPRSLQLGLRINW